MSFIDQKPDAVLLEFRRYLERAAEASRRREGMPVDSEVGSTGDSAVILQFPGRAVQHCERDAGECWERKMVETAVDESLFDNGHSPAAMVEILERTRAAPGAALLALQVSDYHSLTVLLGNRTAARVVGLFEQRLRDVFRANDEVVRVSSVEFLVLLRSRNYREAVAQAAQRVLDQCTGLYALDRATVNLAAHIGIALKPEDTGSPAELVRNARIALREAEAKGDNSYRFFSKKFMERLRDRAWIAAELANAIEEGRLVLHYQPQYDLSSRRLVGFEALVRLRARTGELLLPSRFIEIAEETGLIVRLENWVLDEGCRQLKRWHAGGRAGLVMAINVSPRQLADKDFPDRVEQALADTGLRTEDIELEITERQMVTQDPMIQRTIGALRARNLRMAVDDFGTGYSSFAYLAKLPIDTVKLDLSFLIGLSANDRSRELLRGLVEMINGLGLRLLVEGVETEEQEQFLIRAGCPFAQGFSLGVPQSAEDAANLFLAG